MEELKTLIDSIKKVQNDKIAQFRKELDGNENLILLRHRATIEYGEIIDLSKLDLVFEKNSADRDANKEAILSASRNYEKEILQFVETLNNTPELCLESFNFGSCPLFKNNSKESVQVEKFTAIDPQGNECDIKDVPPEILAAAAAALNSAINNSMEGEGEKKKEAEAEPATV